MQLPKNISYANLQSWLNERQAAPETRRKVIARDQLVRVGGLYRIRDDYQPVWQLHKGEDGKDYIVRLGDDEFAGETMRVADDDGQASVKHAYRTVVGNQVHIVWECENCSCSNITRQGHVYKCDQCQSKFATVMDDERPPEKDVYTRLEARNAFGQAIERKMIANGLNKVHVSLVEVWKKEAEDKKARPKRQHTCIIDPRTGKCTVCGEREKPKEEPGQYHGSRKQAVDFGGLGMSSGGGGFGNNTGPALMNTQPPTTLATGKSPPCPVEGCGKPFGDGGQLKDHLRTEHNIRA